MQRQHSLFFFFIDTATTEIYTLSLHDALPISLLYLNVGAFVLHGPAKVQSRAVRARGGPSGGMWGRTALEDRKSTRLNSSHVEISYAVFCLKKKKKIMANSPKSYLPFPNLHTN